MRRCLEHGGVVLLRFSRTRRGREKFKYSLCERRAHRRTQNGGRVCEIQEERQGSLRRRVSRKRKIFMARRTSSTWRNSTCFETPRPAVLRRRVASPGPTDDSILPPKFGDLIVVWCRIRHDADEHGRSHDHRPADRRSDRGLSDRNRVALARRLRRRPVPTRAR